MTKITMLNVIKAIFDILEDGKEKSSNEIALSCKSSTKTISTYAKMIEYVQSKRKLVVTSAGSEKRTFTFLKLKSDDV